MVDMIRIPQSFLSLPSHLNFHSVGLAVVVFSAVSNFLTWIIGLWLFMGLTTLHKQLSLSSALETMVNDSPTLTTTLRFAGVTISPNEKMRDLPLKLFTGDYFDSFLSTKKNFWPLSEA